jgi:hypothetical protein
MDTYKELIKAVEDGNKSFEEFKARYVTRLEALESSEAKAHRPNLGGSGSDTKATSAETWIDTKSQKAIPVLSHNHALGSLEKQEKGPSVGRVLRGLVLGGRAGDARELETERKALGISSDAAGGFTVAGGLASQWIDLLRAQMVLSRAGARTVPMDNGELTIAPRDR